MAKKGTGRRRRLRLSPEELQILASRTTVTPISLRQRIAWAQEAGWSPPWPTAATSQEMYNRLRQGPGWSAQRVETFDFFFEHQNNRSWWCAPSQKDIERFFEEGSQRGHARRTEELVRAGRLWIVGKKHDTQWIWNELHRGKREEVTGEVLLDRTRLLAEARLCLGGVALDDAEEDRPARRFIMCYRIAYSVEPRLIHGFPVSNRTVTNDQARELISESVTMIRRSLINGRYDGNNRQVLVRRLQAIDQFARTKEWWDATEMLLPQRLREQAETRATRLRQRQRERDRETRRLICEQESSG